MDQDSLGLWYEVSDYNIMMQYDMKWKHPSITKIYEALGAVADGRVEVSSNTAKVYSSSRNKYYDIVYDPDKNQIMSNDNSSFYKGELGYPSIAFSCLLKCFHMTITPQIF